MRKHIMALAVLLVITAICIIFSIHSVKSSNVKIVNSTKSLVDYLKQSQKSNYLQSFTFMQETIRFDDNQKPTDTATWHEAVKYPDMFRIDFGDKEEGNANLNRNDSIYVFRNNELVHRGPEIQEFMILEGGIHFYSVDQALKKLQSIGIDTDVFSNGTYNEKDIYIIGAVENDLTVPQIWLEKEKLQAVRRISKSSRTGNLYDVRYDGYKKFGSHWIETWLKFYKDGKLIQTERYTNIDVNPIFSDSIFDPNVFGTCYWY